MRTPLQRGFASAQNDEFDAFDTTCFKIIRSVLGTPTRQRQGRSSIRPKTASPDPSPTYHDGMDLDPDTAWNALAAHDARFDGRLFVGVTSTRIYCRPVCRVRTPKRENCRFFANAATAEQAVFRPCLRCRPELAPGLSLMDSSQVLAQHAARMMDHAVRNGAAVRMPALAARLGVTERHLRRVFLQAHGVSPIDYLTTQRLLQAKQLLTDTELPVTEVALACGFESLRRFNAVFAEQVRLKPTALRRAGSAAREFPRADASEALMRVRLGYRPPYDVDSMLAFWGQRALAGVE